MAAVRFVAIWCDVQDCPEIYEFAPTATEARREAKAQGWTRRDSKDYCPAHSEDQS